MVAAKMLPAAAAARSDGGSMTTITIMARDGSSHREILASHLEADAIAEREALSVTNIVVTHDGDVFRRVTGSASRGSVGARDG
ncbi:MAG: hypothetical protein EBU31_14905 [Proteobacteria bacterium]|nr:hypothetical protein [Pseudomonadota bacterium]